MALFVGGAVRVRPPLVDLAKSGNCQKLVVWQIMANGKKWQRVAVVLVGGVGGGGGLNCKCRFETILRGYKAF